MSAPGSPTLCLGEALIDLICERPVAGVGEADAFVAHVGGAAANVAVVASRAGTPVMFAGGAGEDDWGRWIARRLEAERVDATLFELVGGVTTPAAIVTVDLDGEPSYQIYGESIAAAIAAIADRALMAVETSAALFLGSNTLVSEQERAVTMRVRERALELGRPIIFDPNLRLRRWRSRADATASANACVPRALLVRATASEAALMTGEDDLERAAQALVKAGAQLVVITLGSDGAMLRGAHRRDVPGVSPRVMRSTIGAGDVLTGTLLARLALSGFYPPAVAAALPEAVAAASRACERWGALE